MERDYPTHPLASVLAVVIRDDRFLLVSRAHEPLRGFWGFPGGLVELGESVTEAARRELFEETGIDARPERLIDVFDVIDRDDEGRVRRHYILNAFLCRWQAGEARAGGDALQAAWFSLAEILDPALPAVPQLPRLARLAQSLQFDPI